ncbi:thiamine ABC transporter substrate binding subunit [Nitrincola alkalilacustris]|uniref:thiamine ABC transporter substrate binding subunit n=1 Tax=Nitrincola alkalilacustris TaxID=1571224 RepID=UPI00124E6336|nr:thiamine ABC transporter substrate binding subunit [Nitrincola alkalilacustris]
MKITSRNLACAALATVLSSASVSASELTVYTYSSFTSSWGPGPQLKTLFEAQCGCSLTYVSSDDGVSLLNRVRLEGSNTRADLIMGIDDALMSQARELGLVQPHGLDLSAWPLRSELDWKDDTFVPFDYGYFAFIYDAERLTEPATSFAELLTSGASVIYQDPRTSTPGQGLMLWINAVHGEQAGEAWQQLAAQTVTVTKGWSEAYSMFLKGESDYVLSYTTSPAYHLVAEEESRYRAAEFSDGHVAQIEVAALSAHAQQVELAQQFLQFLLSEEAQSVIPVTNWMLPVRDDIELPDAFDTLIQPTRIGFSPEVIQQSRPDWIREWRNAVSQ